MKLTIPSNLESLSSVENLVDELSDKLSFDADIYANILVAVTEAVKNSIIHGNKESAEKVVIIGYDNTEKCIEFSISDEGEGFEYWNVPDPTVPENIEKEKGRGIFLMENLADDVIFNDNGTEVSLKFNY